VTPYVIPTYYTANSSAATAAVNAMSASVRAFQAQVDATNARVQSSFLGKELAATGIIAGLGLAAKSLMEYEKSLASFRTYISSVSNTGFAKFKAEIESLATETHSSSIEVADAFRKIAINPEFAKTPQSMRDMAEAAITLNRAAGGELMQTTQDLVAIMNQYGMSADQAARTSNALAAGLTIGGSSIQQTSEALRIFGAIAKQSNTNIEQSVALIEVLSQKNILGADAGQKLAEVYRALQKTGLAYKNGVFDIDYALQQVSIRLANVTNEHQRNAIAMGIFGESAYGAGLILLENANKVKNFTTQVTGTSAATEKAAINMNTLFGSLTILKNDFITATTTGTTANVMLAALTGAVRLLDALMGPLVTGFALWASWLAITKGALLAQMLVVGAWANTIKVINFLQGVATALNGQYAASCFATEAGMYGMATAAFFLEIGLWGTLGILGLVAAAIGLLVYNFNGGVDAQYRYYTSLEETRNGFNKLKQPINDATIALEKYNKEVADYAQQQDRLARLDYIRRHGDFFDWLPAALMEGLTHPYYIAKPPVKPNINESDIQRSELPTSANAMLQRTETTNNNHLTIDLNNNTSLDASVSNNTGNVPVWVNSYWNYGR